MALEFEDISSCMAHNLVSLDFGYFWAWVKPANGIVPHQKNVQSIAFAAPLSSVRSCGYPERTESLYSTTEIFEGPWYRIRYIALHRMAKDGGF